MRVPICLLASQQTNSRWFPNSYAKPPQPAANTLQTASPMKLLHELWYILVHVLLVRHVCENIYISLRDVCSIKRCLQSFPFLCSPRVAPSDVLFWYDQKCPLDKATELPLNRRNEGSGIDFLFSLCTFLWSMLNYL